MALAYLAVSALPFFPLTAVIDLEPLAGAAVLPPGYELRVNMALAGRETISFPVRFGPTSSWMDAQDAFLSALGGEKWDVSHAGFRLVVIGQPGAPVSRMDITANNGPAPTVRWSPRAVAPKK